jgi:DNA-binding transcriptional ArsR family regulator
MTPLPQPVTAVVALEPVYSILMSMAALRNPEDYGGLEEWVLQSASSMEPALRAEHQLLFGWLWLDALTNAVARGPATESFPAYLAALAAQDPIVLRDNLFYWLINSPHLRVGYEYRLDLPTTMQPMTQPDLNRFLSHAPAFGDLMTERGGGKAEELESVAVIHALFNQPAHLQRRLVTHLQSLWDRFLADEWLRVQPRLQATVAAFQPISLENLAILEALQVVTGRDLRPVFRLDTLLTYRHIRFIPHAHSGPYIVWFGNDEELRIGFPARQPLTAAHRRPTFDLITAVNRYKALADETRLAILLAMRETGELSTQAVIDQFALDKSAASRHLRQLVATSLIEEMRTEGAKKVYRINGKTIVELTQLLAQLT